MTHEATSYPKSTLVYLLKVLNDDLYKVGRTSYLRERVRVLSKEQNTELEVIHTIPMSSFMESCKFETALLHHLREYRVQGEWFRLPRLSVWDSAVVETFNIVARLDQQKQAKVDKKIVLRQLPQSVVIPLMSVSVPRTEHLIKSIRLQARRDVCMSPTNGIAVKQLRMENRLRLLGKS